MNLVHMEHVPEGPGSYKYEPGSWLMMDLVHMEHVTQCPGSNGLEQHLRVDHKLQFTAGLVFWP
jgi:hypothetical protein